MVQAMKAKVPGGTGTATLRSSGTTGKTHDGYDGVRLTTIDLQKVYRVIEEQVGLAIQTYEDIEKIYAVGEATDLDLLEARRTLIEARKTYADALFNYDVALAALEKSIGQGFKGDIR